MTGVSEDDLEAREIALDVLDQYYRREPGDLAESTATKAPDASIDHDGSLRLCRDDRAQRLEDHSRLAATARTAEDDQLHPGCGCESCVQLAYILRPSNQIRSMMKYDGFSQKTVEITIWADEYIGIRRNMVIDIPLDVVIPGLHPSRILDIDLAAITRIDRHQVSPPGLVIGTVAPCTPTSRETRHGPNVPSGEPEGIQFRQNILMRDLWT